MSWVSLLVVIHVELTCIVSWLPSSLSVHCKLGFIVSLRPLCEASIASRLELWVGLVREVQRICPHVRTKNLWSFMLRVVEGRHDGRRPEDIRWSRVDVMERSGSTWNRSTSYPPPRILGWVEVRWGWVSAVWGSTQLWVLRGGWGTPLGRMVKGSTWRTCSFKFEV